MLDPDREPDQGRRAPRSPIPPGRRGSYGPDARSATRRRPATRRGRRRGCPRRREAPSPRTRSRTTPCPRSAPRRAHLLAGEPVAGDVLEPRVVDALHGRMLAQERRHPLGVGAVLPHPHRQRLEPAQQQPAVERPRHAAGRVLQEAISRSASSSSRRSPRRRPRRSARPGTWSSSGRRRPRRAAAAAGRYGEAKVLSTTNRAPAACASSATRRDVDDLSSGLVGVSSQTSFGLRASIASNAARSVTSTVS